MNDSKFVKTALLFLSVIIAGALVWAGKNAAMNFAWLLGANPYIRNISQFAIIFIIPLAVSIQLIRRNYDKIS